MNKSEQDKSVSSSKKKKKQSKDLMFKNKATESYKV